MDTPRKNRRIVQVHPTRLCNLRCAHCYSSSGPTRTGALPLSVLGDALADAAREGYDTLSVSGGEPLLYPRLFDLLAGARDLGMRTMLTSNGLLLEAAVVERLRECTDLIAISVDGAPARHDRMRGREGAFAEMEARLEPLRRAGIPFAFLFTLTRSNAGELEWVARFAADQGAVLLQVHALELIGRAAQQLAGAEPDAIEGAVAWLEADRLRSLDRRLPIHVDLVDRDDLRDHPELMSGAPEDEGSEFTPLADLLQPIVIEPDGTVTPLTYGFPRHYALGSLFDAPLAALADQWRRHRRHAFAELCRIAHRELSHEDAPRLVNLHRALADRAADPSLRQLLPVAPLW